MKPHAWFILFAIALLALLLRLRRTRERESPGQEPDPACDGCVYPRREQVGVLVTVAGDAQGELFRCPSCGQYYHLDRVAFGGGRFKAVEESWALRMLPSFGRHAGPSTNPAEDGTSRRG